ncbi:hypothetical protein HDV00_000143 [Rhizophlyctis rosea]|nr:hypothetical protein HDV00_000143 [Rhizophlyctis rosea]
MKPGLLSSTSQRVTKVEESQIDRELRKLLDDDQDDDDELLSMPFSMTPTASRSVDVALSDIRRSSRMKKDVNYKPPPLDPLQDEELLAQGDTSTGAWQMNAVSHHVTPNKKRKFDLESLLKGKKKQEERMKRYQEMDMLKLEEADVVDQERENSILGGNRILKESGSPIASITTLENVKPRMFQRCKVGEAIDGIV